MTLEQLIVRIEAHRALRHPLFRYLKTHAEDAVNWDIFATHHHRAVASIMLSFPLLRSRLHAEAQEILEHLIETTAVERLLLPLGFTVLGDFCRDLAQLVEVESFGMFHIVSMKIKPLPTALGILYTLCLTPEWIERMDLILAPFTERMDLIHAGLDAALEVRARMLDAIYEAVTGREVRHA